MICNYSPLELINALFILYLIYFLCSLKKGPQGGHRKGRLTNETAGDSARGGRYQDVLSPS